MAGEAMLLAGIDGGQTATRAVLARADGSLIAAGVGPPCDNLNTAGGVERNRVAIHAALLDACATASVAVGEIDVLGLGLTSAQPELDPVPVIASIVHEIVNPETLWIGHDVVSNLAGASGGDPGIVVIAGGGSVSHGVNGSGREATSGGLGYLMGDEGSGWYFGIEALWAAARGADGRGPVTALLPMILESWGLGNIRECVQVLYREDFRRNEVAALAPEVFRVAAEGDLAAAAIVERGARSLAGHVVAVANRLYQPGDTVDVYPTGGIFNAGAIIDDPFRQTVEAHWPTVEFRSPRFVPAVGAMIKAAQQAGLAIDDAFLHRLDTTHGRGAG